MLFVKAGLLKVGMRLAKPIYNKDGTLLYERNSKLTDQGVVAISNFGLIGIYILEEGEPVPPMTEEDIEFEKFQVVTVYRINDELKRMADLKMPQNMEGIARTILEKYGSSDRNINFVQNLRTKEDYVAKHSLNVAILCALMATAMRFTPIEKEQLVIAALFHDLGKIHMTSDLIGKENVMTEVESTTMSISETAGLELMKKMYDPQSQIVRTIIQVSNAIHAFRYKGDTTFANKLQKGSRIFIAAEIFDTMTAMNDFTRPTSEIAALKYMMENIRYFGSDIVDALMKSINFLPEGCCVELSNGENGIVLYKNSADVLKPRVLSFKTNQIIELKRQKKGKKIEVKDAMKTFDNRIVIDRKLWDEYTEKLGNAAKPQKFDIIT